MSPDHHQALALVTAVGQYLDSIGAYAVPEQDAEAVLVAAQRLIAAVSRPAAPTDPSRPSECVCGDVS